MGKEVAADIVVGVVERGVAELQILRVMVTSCGALRTNRPKLLSLICQCSAAVQVKGRSKSGILPGADCGKGGFAVLTGFVDQGHFNVPFEVVVGLGLES